MTDHLTPVTLHGRSIGAHAIPADVPVGSVVALDASSVRYRIVARTDASGTEVVEVEVCPMTTTPEPAVSGPQPAVTRWVESTDGVSVALHHMGGTGSPVLICHATGFNSFAYAPVAHALSHRHSVWAADLRGHGATAAPADGNLGWSGMGRDVTAVVAAIREEDDRPLYAFGHSMGGAATLFAERAHPGTFARAYFFEPIVFSEQPIQSERENFMRDAARARRAIFPDRNAAFERYGSRPPLQWLRPDALASYVQHGFVDTAEGEVTLACEPESESKTFGTPEKLFLHMVTELGLPMAVAAGRTEESGSPADFAPLLAETVADGVVDEQRDLSHFGPLEAPDHIANRAAEFFAVEKQANTRG